MGSVSQEPVERLDRIAKVNTYLETELSFSRPSPLIDPCRLEDGPRGEDKSGEVAGVYSLAHVGVASTPILSLLDRFPAEIIGWSESITPSGIPDMKWSVGEIS